MEMFLTRAFIRRDPTVRPPCRLHENLRVSVTGGDAHTSDG
jgi:hypothetical protein